MIKRWKQFNELYVQSSKINCINDTVDFGVLTKLEDERNSLVEGDEVIATYHSGGFDTYQFTLSRWYESTTGEYILGCTSDDRMFTIDDAYHIVKKETYDDFVDPENQLLEKAAPKKKQYTQHSIDPGILYISTEIEVETREEYINAIDGVFYDLHNKFKTVSGDANFTTENLIEIYRNHSLNIIETTVDQIISNMNLSSIVSLTSDRVNFQILSELKDERHSIEAGEDVIIVTKMNSNKINNHLIKVVVGKSTLLEKDCFVCGTKGADQFLVYDKKHDLGRYTLLCVKKETYEDFAGPLK